MTWDAFLFFLLVFLVLLFGASLRFLFTYLESYFQMRGWKKGVGKKF